MLLKTTGKPRPPTSTGVRLVFVSSKCRTRRFEASSSQDRVTRSGRFVRTPEIVGVRSADASSVEERRKGVPGDSEERREGVPGDSAPSGALASATAIGVTGLRTSLDDKSTHAPSCQP